MNVQDDLYLGPPSLMVPGGTLNPTLQSGAGPLGRIAFLNVVPLTKGAANVAALANTVAAVAMALAAGTGTTAGVAPDGSGRTVIVLDCPRCVSVGSAANFSACNFVVTGFDAFGRLQTNTFAGPNNGTAVGTKAFKSILSVVPSASVASNVSIGTADKFGLPWYVADAGYLSRVGWANALAEDAGTFVAGDATDPATATTTDPRGTYVPSSAADGAKRLVIGMHLTASQCGPGATLVGALGITPV